MRNCIVGFVGCEGDQFCVWSFGLGVWGFGS